MKWFKATGLDWQCGVQSDSLTSAGACYSRAEWPQSWRVSCCAPWSPTHRQCPERGAELTALLHSTALFHSIECSESTLWSGREPTRRERRSSLWQPLEEPANLPSTPNSMLQLEGPGLKDTEGACSHLMCVCVYWSLQTGKHLTHSTGRSRKLCCAQVCEKVISIKQLTVFPLLSWQCYCGTGIIIMASSNCNDNN